MRKIIDLNCDMGEGFGHWVLGEAPDEDLMALISSANIAAGFHAGDPNSMDRVIKLAQDYGVGLGAHPGYRDLQGFGRRYMQTTPEELVNDIIYQVGAVREFGRRHGIRLQHVKPHGALYMEAAKNEELSRHMIESLAAISGDTPDRIWPVIIPGSETSPTANSELIKGIIAARRAARLALP